MREKIELGRLGERLVARLLVERGFSIVAQNLRLGPLELDIVARRGGLLVICEVRARSSGTVVDPAYTFTEEKRARVRAAARRYLASRKAPAFDELRFDAAAVTVDARTRRARVRYIPGAF